MATTETSHSQSADSYIGSFISLISKSDIRYEGVIFHINPLQSSIGIKNVRSFGTEGRNKDGPQVVPSDKVYDYIYFRGSDIKDLQVLSSLSVQSKSAIPDDPAIIQSHYHHPAASSIMPHSASSSMTSFTSNSQLGLPSSAFQDSVPQYQPVGHVLSLDSSTSTTVKSNEHNMPTYWQGLNGPLGGYSFLQQQSLLRPPPGLLTSSGLRQMQHSIMDASIPSAVPNFSEIPHPLFPPSSSSSLNSRLLPSSSASSLNSTLLPSSSSASSLISTLLPSSSASSQNTTTLPPSSYSSQRSTMLPPSSGSSLNSTLTSISSSALPSNLPLGYAASSVSKEALVSNAPGLKLSSCLPLASALTSAVDTIKIALQFGEKSKSTLGSTSSYTNMSTHTPSIVGTSVSNHPEVPTPSLVTPGQLLQSAPTSPDTILFSLLPLQTAQKDIEVVQTSTLEPLSADANEAQAPSGEMNGASLDSQHHDKGRERGRRNRPYGSDLHTPRSISGPVEERENKSNGVTLQSHPANKVHARRRRNGLYGTASHSHPSNISPSWRLENVMNGTAPHPYYGSWGRAHGRTNMISHFVTKFTEDFDFEAMNKKFNKDEVWGQLGKSIEGISEDNGDADDSQKDDRQHDDGYGLLKVDIKPVYVKDEFFDSLSCNTFDREPKQGRSKFSEQKKLDVETFGGFRINHGGHGDRGVGRGGWSRGSRYGRGYGHGGRGLGRGVWSRVD